MTLGNCEPVSFQLCCQCYDITNASVVFQSATATCSALEKEVSFFGSHQMSYPVPTGKNDDFSPRSPSLKKVSKRGLTERGGARAAAWEDRTPSGMSTVAAAGREGAQGEGRSAQRKLRLPYCSQRTATLAPSGSLGNCRLAVGRKATPVLCQLCLDGGSSLFSYLCLYFCTCVSQHGVPWPAQMKPPQQTRAERGLSSSLTLPCTTGIAQGQRRGPEGREVRITLFLCCLFCWLDLPGW